MKKIVLLTVVITLIAATALLFLGRYFWQEPWKPRPEGLPTPVPAGEGWIDLLSAEHAPLWENINDDMDLFSIEDDMLHIYGRSKGRLRYAGYTGRAFSDFELHLEFRLARRTNSGLFLRVQENDPVRRGFEVQIIDDHGRAPTVYGSGAIYDVVSPMFNMARPTGEWNSLDITARDGHIVVVMNGWKVIDTDLSQMSSPIGKFTIPFAELPREGLLALQDHGGAIWYRNIHVRPLNEDGTQAAAAVERP